MDVRRPFLLPGSLGELASYFIFRYIRCGRCSGRGLVRGDDDCDICLGDRTVAVTLMPGFGLDGSALVAYPMEGSTVPCMACWNTPEPEEEGAA